MSRLKSLLNLKFLPSHVKVLMKFCSFMDKAFNCFSKYSSKFKFMNPTNREDPTSIGDVYFYTLAYFFIIIFSPFALVLFSFYVMNYYIGQLIIKSPFSKKDPWYVISMILFLSIIVVESTFLIYTLKQLKDKGVIEELFSMALVAFGLSILMIFPVFFSELKFIVEKEKEILNNFSGCEPESNKKYSWTSRKMSQIKAYLSRDLKEDVE